MRGSGAFLGGHGGDQKLALFVPSLDPAINGLQVQRTL